MRAPRRITGAREELILVLAGAGEAVHVPPHCAHDVINTGAVAPAILLPAAS
jgi:oxalate decarboxylase/phosphoglucose isomerase-like protein (cupin superfamily)